MQKFFFFLKKIKYTLLYLIPLFLITGPFLGDLATSLIGIFFVSICIYEKRIKYFKNIYFLIFIFFCFYIILLSLFSEHIYLSLESSLFYIRFGLLALAIWYSLEHNAKFSYYFTISLISCFTILLCDSYFQFFFGTNILGWTRDSLRLSSLFGSEYILGSYLSRFLPLLFGLCLLHFSKNRLDILLAIILLVLSDVIIYLSGERVAFINLFIATIIIILLFNKYQKIRLLSFLFSIIIVTIITISFPNVKYRMIDQTTNDLFQNTNQSNIKFNYLSTTHEKIYLTAMKIAKNNFLFGIGPKVFREECKKEKYYIESGCTSHPHNNFLQLLSETGIIGALLYLIIFIYVSYKFLQTFIFRYIVSKKTILSDYQICLYVCIFINFLPFIPSGNFFNNWLSIIYFIPFGFILYSLDKNVNN